MILSPLRKVDHATAEHELLKHGRYLDWTEVTTNTFTLIEEFKVENSI